MPAPPHHSSPCNGGESQSGYYFLLNILYVNKKILLNPVVGYCLACGWKSGSSWATRLSLSSFLRLFNTAVAGESLTNLRPQVGCGTTGWMEVASMTAGCHLMCPHAQGSAVDTLGTETVAGQISSSSSSPLAWLLRKDSMAKLQEKSLSARYTSRT